MKIPDQVKIGGFIWRVEYDATRSAEDEAFGMCRKIPQIITLDPSMTQQKKEQCLLHEIMHACVWQLGLDERFKAQVTEEEVVSALSMMLHQVLKENQLHFDV